jgi:hypothetical protein
MTRLPYIVTAYALGVLIPGWFAVAAFIRMRTAQRRLAAVGRRRRAPRDVPRDMPRDMQ